jgi:hypothetical protein
VRPGHAFEGRELQVFSRCKRARQLQLLLILPDESRSLIPASWTDWAARKHGTSLAPSEPGILAALADLLKTRALVDALLGHMAQAKESDDATRTGSVGAP